MICLLKLISSLFFIYRIMATWGILVLQQFHTASSLYNLSCYLDIWPCSISNPDVFCWSNLPSTPIFPTVFPGTHEILINLYIVSTKASSFSSLEEMQELIVPGFLMASWLFSIGRHGSRGGAGKANKREKRREKTEAVSSEVVGHDLINSTAMKSIDPPPAH